jgi:hypothetical protein
MYLENDVPFRFCQIICNHKVSNRLLYHDGRYKAGSPRTSVAPPVELFHHAFGHFLDDVKREDPILEDVVRKTTAYMKEASAVYANESTRRDRLDPLLIDLLGVNIQSVVNSDKTCPDGGVEFSRACCNLA